jgi:hypothetical protein
MFGVHQTVSDAQAGQPANRPLSEIRQDVAAIIHRTVRCTPDCLVCLANGHPRNMRKTRHPGQRSLGRTRLSSAPLDCPVCQVINGRLRQGRKTIVYCAVSGVHRTIWCTADRRQPGPYKWSSNDY